MQVIDNFLPQEEFDTIKNAVDDGYFPWFFTENVSDPSDNSDCYFVHTFYSDFKPNSQLITVINPILQKIAPNALIRCRAIMHIGRDKLIEHGRHIDFNYPHKTFILYLNSNNGFTRMHDGQCVNSVANRALFFDGSLEHNSSNCTNQKTRQLITINYF